jgi:pimeloyl-ACP methyl ester carboxylesterase
MTTVFIIAGYILGQSAATIKEFDEFEQLLQAKGYVVVRVDILYNEHIHSTYIAEFISRYKALKTKKNIVIGNSFGAVVALFSAAQFQPDELYLCSMSPFFKETLQNKQFYDYAVREFGSSRTEDLATYSMYDQASVINRLHVPVHFTYGELETGVYTHLVDFNKDYQPFFTNSDIRKIPHAPHGFRDPNYYRALVELL